MSKFTEAVEKNRKGLKLSEADEEVIRNGNDILSEIPPEYDIQLLMTKQLTQPLSKIETEILSIQLQLLSDSEYETPDESSANDELVKQLMSEKIE